MMIERLKDYQSKKGHWPSNILMYRDGVSESQYGMVNEEELPQIIAAYDDCGIEEHCRPHITLLVVVKRHHTRFYQQDSNKNFKAGLCVDSAVVAPNLFNFYLQSHDSPQGTARNGHYVVIHNGSGYSARHLQEIVSFPLIEEK